MWASPGLWRCSYVLGIPEVAGGEVQGERERDEMRNWLLDWVFGLLPCNGLFRTGNGLMLTGA